MSDLQSRVAKLLMKGLAPETIAGSLGLDVSVVYDIARNNIESIQMAGVERLEENAAMDDLHSSTEMLALTRLAGVLASETDVKKLTTAFTALNKAQKRHDRLGENARQPEAAQVTIVLPASNVERRQQEVNDVTDGANQVVEVDGRAMVTLDAKRVMLAARQSNPNIEKMMEQRGIGANVSTVAGPKGITLEDL